MMKQRKKGTLKKVLSYIKNYRFFAALSLLCAVVTVVLTLYLPILIGRAIDYIIAPNQVDFSKIKSILILVAIMVVATAISQWLMNICNNRITFHVTHDIRRDAMRKIEQLPLNYLDTHSYGDIVSRVITDVDQFADGLLMGFTQLFTGVLTIIGTLSFMFSINIPIAIMVVCLTPISLLVARFIATRTYSMFLSQSKIRGEQTAFIDEMIQGEKVVKAFNYESEAEKRFDEINDELQKCSLKAVFFSSLTNPSTRFVNSLVYAGVIIMGAFFAIRGNLSIGQLTCFLSYATQYTKPFNEISEVITELQNAFACAARIFELIDEKPQSPDPEDAISPKQIKGEVCLDHVYFSYTPDHPLIENVNLHVKPGQRIAIVGPTGCGKTTLINLLMRFYDVNQGMITVDGVDIKDMRRGDLREMYGMVLQDTWIKTGTIRDNITIGKPEATEEEIIRAAKESHSYSFIKRLPKGLDTWITEEGGGLSQGQKQLLCITRVMLCLPPMLILDEATSSIDTRTEVKIQNAFAKMMEGRTSFIVAHRLSTIQTADVILVMKDGHVIEQGTHEELLTKNGFYANLYQSQFEH